ncbi:Inner membrane protein YebZ [Raoultella planticola]|uniref:Inner membrane protein YebZ n=1 Tax=Raoultella planticola TaxID=575 RepID=A0A485APZ4_RAOPL|nr:Inner membrane protein YebZ [Raoultella planticola]
MIKCALVAGMVAIALVNRYVLVPRMSVSGTRAEQLILRTTQVEMALGALALLARQSVCNLGTLLN